MAVKATRVAVSHETPTPLLVRGGSLEGASGVVANLTSTAIIYLGGADVTAAAGYPWHFADGDFPFEIKPGEALYGIVKEGDADQHCAILANSQ